MRFRLATAGQGQQPGLSSIGSSFQNMAMLPMLQAQAAEEAQAAEQKRQLQGAQMRQADAHAALFGAQAEAERSQLQRGGIGELTRTAALMNKVPMHQLQEYTDFAQSGQLEPRYELPGAVAGPTLPKPAYADPAVGSQIMQTLGLLRGGLTVGDKSIDNVAQAQGRLQDQGVMADAVAAAGRGDDMAMSRLNAVRGKKEFTPYAAVGTTGTALNQVTGQQNVSNEGLRVLFGRGEEAQIGQRTAAAGASNASAANSYASANQHRAQTDKIKQDIEQGGTTGHIALVTGTDGVVTAVDKRTLQATPLVGPDGRPVVKGKSGGAGGTGVGGKLPGEIQRMTIAMEALEAGLDSYETALKSFDPRGMGQFSTEQRANIKALMADIQMQFKEAQALGALTGPDLEVLSKALTDPATLSGMAYGRPGLNAQLKQAREGINRRRVALANQFNRPDLGPGGAAGQADPLGLRRK